MLFTSDSYITSEFVYAFYIIYVYLNGRVLDHFFV